MTETHILTPEYHEKKDRWDFDPDLLAIDLTSALAITDMEERLTQLNFIYIYISEKKRQLEEEIFNKNVIGGQ